MKSMVSMETTAASAPTLAAELDLLFEGYGRGTGDPLVSQPLTLMRMRILWNFLRDPFLREGLGLLAAVLVLGLLTVALVA